MSYQVSMPSGRRRQVVGLDSLRFICALWVAMHHGARPEVAAWLGLSDVARDWNAIAVDGVAAVTVFFVISGLCVHYPYARSEPCHLPAFYTQRFIRIGVPFLLVAGFVELAGRFVGDDIAAAPRVVMWSLWCELIYYSLYPILLIGFRKIGMVPIISAAFVAAYAVIIGHWHVMSYWQYPRALMWVAALPAWLLGCALAQIVATGRLPILRGPIWGWRAAIMLLSIPPKALVYPSVSPILIGNPATLGVFSIFVFFWLMKEIATFESHAPPALLEWGGRWSYSLYLVHTTIIVAFMQRGGWINHFVRWPLRLTAILAASYAFYCVVERPAHRLARSLGRRLAAGPPLSVVPIVRPVHLPPEAPS
jgi:peptidoglycan/LPS O-acetylase OafA/YrhL